MLNYPYGKFLKIKWVSIVQEKEVLFLRIGQIQVDYKGLADIQMMKDTEGYGDFIEEEVHLTLTDGMEADILDALAGYLRDGDRIQAGGKNCLSDAGTWPVKKPLPFLWQWFFFRKFLFFWDRSSFFFV